MGTKLNRYLGRIRPQVGDEIWRIEFEDGESRWGWPISTVVRVEAQLDTDQPNYGLIMVTLETNGELWEIRYLRSFGFPKSYGLKRGNVILQGKSPDILEEIPWSTVEIIERNAYYWYHCLFRSSTDPKYAVPDGLLFIEAEAFMDDMDSITYNVLRSLDGNVYSDELGVNDYAEGVYDEKVATLTGYWGGRLLTVKEQTMKWNADGSLGRTHSWSEVPNSDRQDVIAFKDSVLIYVVAAYVYGFGNITQLKFGVELNARGDIIRFVPEGTMEQILRHIRNSYEVDQAEKLK